MSPQSVEELAEVVASEPRLRVLGSRHSFNDVADTDGVLVSLAGMTDSSEVQRVGAGTVRVPMAPDLIAERYPAGTTSASFAPNWIRNVTSAIRI